MNKAFKYRLYPNKEQQQLFAKTFGCVRFLYNKMLSDKIEYYKETKQKLNNTPAQYKKEFEWLKEVDSLALANAQMNLQSAYNNFFRNTKVGFPKFKSKKHNKNTYTTNNQNGTISITANHIKLPKVGIVKMVYHRTIPADYKIKSAIISLTASGKYYVSVLTEYETNIPTIKLDKNKSLGLDYSRDNGFGMFRTFLQYKLYNRGKQFIVIDKWFPSSKMCRFCGAVNKDLKLSDRVWTCSCGKTLNRDENAAINILNVGLSMV